MYAKTLLQVCGFCLLASGLEAAGILLVADKASIIQVSLQQSSSQPLAIRSSCLKMPQDVVYDSVDRRVYWTDNYSSSICRAFLNGSSVETVQNNTSSKGITIDILQRKLFWTNVEMRTIESCNLDGSNRKPVVQHGIYRPSGVVVDSEKKYLYWADRGDFKRIERSNYDGQSKDIILNTTLEVTSLALDKSLNTLYLVSESGNAIQALSLGSSKESRQMVWNISVPNPYGIVVSGQYIYWSNTSSVYRADKISGKNIELVRGNFVKALGITAIDSEEIPTISTTSPDSRNTVCLHGGVLPSESPKSANPKCSCLSNYIGRLCQLSKELALLGAVNITLEKRDDKWHKANFKTAIATALNNFCNKNKCSKIPRNKRGRSGISDVEYKSDDVIIFDGYPKDLGDSWLVKFVVVHNFGNNKRSEALTLDKVTVEKAILKNKGSLEKELGARIVRINTQTVVSGESNPNAPESNKSVAIAVGTIAAIVCLTIGIAAMLYIRKKRKSHDAETEFKETPNYAFYEDEFQLPQPPPPPPPPQAPSAPPIPSNPPTFLREENTYTQHPMSESWNISPLHRHIISQVHDGMDGKDGIGKDTTGSGSIHSIETGVKSHFMRFKASFKGKSHRSSRSNSTPIKQRRAGTLERNSLPRPHSDVLPKTRHHVYDVPRIHPQKAPMTLRALKPQLPPKEKTYILETDPPTLENPDSSV